ncbi:GNAT family N-acetyltransferase [Kitasatospora sp. NPDC088391]|uniref:GNAT family N-acetyltransferase n=1 Tax=Kitasatospora sp. NPDC088391 TaxID=3364074 RepID=UPI0038268716
MLSGAGEGIEQPWGRVELVPLRAEHAPAVLAFERANRAYFAASITDRGDAFFAHYADRHRALLDEQRAGISAFHLVLAEDGSVLGRFNLMDLVDGTATLGYRVARRAAGRGLATATVRELCRLAPGRYGLTTLRAAVAEGNAASRRVLAKAGFVLLGPADPAEIGGETGSWYVCDLMAEAADTVGAVGRDEN